MKSFAERNQIVVGAVELAITIGIVVGSLQYDKLPLFQSGKQYSACFADAGGLTTGVRVQVSGFRVGEVSSIELDGPRVLVKFTVDKHIRLGDHTEAAIKTRACWARRCSRSSPAGTASCRARFRSTAPGRRTNYPTRWVTWPPRSAA
ncbi:mce related family protein [Mycobacterium ulcerans str. Harvey]|uniref:Mce related family protein n=1 Tax=Mycobacterium ulcerans str. Harvey TaxID=1299332 RepID=A0ABN0QR47_MYCUL|nr:mce related family protein [Mycobacterium ulcerans str. Harvey]